jgi:hypothetical protein
MKLPENFQNAPTAGKFNTFMFLGISLVWGHMLDLISIWFLPLTVLSIMIAYGSEVNANKKKDLVL